MVRAEAGVNTSQDHQCPGKAFLDQPDGRNNPGIPVSHEGGDQDGRGGRKQGQAGPEVRLLDAVAPETPGDIGKGRRGGNDLLGVAAGAEGTGAAVVHIQAIEEVDLRPQAPEPARQIEEPQGAGKEIIGCEIVDPGVDEQQGWLGGNHLKNPLGIGKKVHRI